MVRSRNMFFLENLHQQWSTNIHSPEPSVLGSNSNMLFHPCRKGDLLIDQGTCHGLNAVIVCVCVWCVSSKTIVLLLRQLYCSFSWCNQQLSQNKRCNHMQVINQTPDVSKGVLLEQSL